MLTVPYATLDELKRRMSVTGDQHDADLAAELLAASQWISNETGRTFALANDATARTFRADRPGWRCRIDDLSVEDDNGAAQAPTVKTTTGGRVGTFSAHSGEVIRHDVQGSGVVDILEGDTVTFPVGRGCWVEVTPAATSAGWGWAHVPAPIVEATLLLANRLHKRRNTPEGLVGFESGVSRISTRDADVMELVRPYVRVEKWAP